MAPSDDPRERTFSSARRGYDQQEVRAYLRILVDELSAARARIAELEAQSTAHVRALAPEVPLDDATVAAHLGEEAGRVLLVAHEAASEMRAKAEDHLQRTLRESQDEAARVRSEAEVDAARRREAATAEASAEVERAKAEGRHMVAEAQAVRERMLTDLARRRDVGRRQLEQLKAGRDRMLAAYDEVRRSLDAVTAELQSSVPEAQALAEGALARPLEDLVDASPADVLSPDVDLSPAIDDIPTDLPEPEPEAAEEADEAAEKAPETAAEAESAVVPEPPAIEEPIAEPAQGVVSVVELVEITEVVEITEIMPVVDVAEPEAEVAPSNVVDLNADRDDDDDDHDPPVEDLFARLRAARENEVASAHAVLGHEGAAATVAMHQPETDTSDDGAQSEGSEPAELDAFGRRRAALELVERSMARHLKRALADEQNEVLDRLRQSRRTPDADDLLGDLIAHAERYRQVAEKDVEAAARAGARANGATDAEADAALAKGRVMDAALAELGLQMTGMLRDRVEHCLDESGGDPDEAAHQLRAAYREVKSQRLDATAAHIAVSAYAKGMFATLPSGSRVCWAVDPDGPQCPDAEDNALAGVMVLGEEFPTGHSNAPAHVGCRCLVMPAEK